MSDSPFNRQNLTQASKLGTGLAVGGIVLFVVLWLVLGSVGVDHIPRLLVSLCLPPALMAGAIGGYMLLARPR